MSNWKPKKNQGIFRKPLTYFAVSLASLVFSAQSHSVPATGLDSCARPDQLPADCLFTFTGGRPAGVVDGQTTAGPPPLPQYFVLDGFFMPHLETQKPGDLSDLFMANSYGSEPGAADDWSDPKFIFDGFIDGKGQLNSQPEMLGDLVFWHGFAWHWEADCKVAADSKCGQLDVYSDITFKSVRIGDWEKVPAPATLALFGIGLAGLGWSRRKKV